MRFARVQTYGDTTHTFMEFPKNYLGLFLPGYKLPKIKVGNNIQQSNQILIHKIIHAAFRVLLKTNFYIKDCLLENLPSIGALYIDHIVGNQPDLTMEDAAKWLVNFCFNHTFNFFA